jgi:hypothetical protein
MADRGAPLNGTAVPPNPKRPAPDSVHLKDRAPSGDAGFPLPPPAGPAKTRYTTRRCPSQPRSKSFTSPPRPSTRSLGPCWPASATRAAGGWANAWKGLADQSETTFCKWVNVQLIQLWGGWLNTSSRLAWSAAAVRRRSWSGSSTRPGKHDDVVRVHFVRRGRNIDLTAGHPVAQPGCLREVGRVGVVGVDEFKAEPRGTPEGQMRGIPANRIAHVRDRLPNVPGQATCLNSAPVVLDEWGERTAARGRGLEKVLWFHGAVAPSQE